MAPPKILYRYRSFPGEGKHLRLNKIWFAAPHSFNDPFDCRIPFEIEESSPMQIRRALEVATAQRNPELNRKGRRKTVKERVRNFNRNRRNPERMQKIKDDMVTSMNERFGILSLTEDPENILMWSHYAQKHEGYCIGFDTKRLMDSLRVYANRSRNSFILLPVEYQEDYPRLVLDDSIERIEILNRMLTIKSMQWEYEKEYRLIINGESNFELDIPSEVITTVMLGARTSERMKGRMYRYLDKFSPDVRINELVVHNKRFALKEKT